jgi:Zn-dependent M28 family amino/carboxypeptidase
MIRSTLALFALFAAACTNGPAPHATPAALLAHVAEFAQPTPADRLAVLKSQLDAAGLPYTVETFTGPRGLPGSNVVVGADPAGRREILMVAHYDAIVLRGGKLADGIVDNAASVVAMIETMRRVSGQTKHPVRLLLADQEELGLVGARDFVSRHGVANLAAVINADVNANGDTLMYGLNNGAQSAFMVKAVQELCAARAMSCLDFPEYPPSDDRAFSGAGAPVISLGHQPKDEAAKMRAFLLNPPTSAPDPAAIPAVLALIHTPNDKIDRVEPATLAQAADVFTALVMKLDGELP